ncbi:KpsF/GutQ family sugar-phosphate isomerase [bacterium]|nr:KpsF/GutQ family sugar-phosphate isomerase [bacterium]
MDIIESANEVLEIEAKSVIDLKRSVNDDFVKAIDILYNCKGRVIVTGMGKSGHIGRKISATLSSTGTPSYFLHPAESIHGDSGMITKDDVIIAISNSGETEEIKNLLPLINRFGVKMIAMTGNKNSTLGKAGDVTLDVGVEKEACPLNKAPTASTTATLAMGDALAICLLKKRGFTAEDFLMFHPGGALGKGVIYKVSDLMITGEKLPVIDETENFIEVIKFISDKKLGMAILTDENGLMTGILTDGDIRRTLIKESNVQNLAVKDVMTKNPKTVLSTDLAAKALHLMEKYSITTLAIVDENKKPVGVVHIHDLLKAGVA